MSTDGNTVRENEMVGSHMDLRVVKEWAKRTFTKERSAEATARLVVLSYIGIVLAQVFMTY